MSSQSRCRTSKADVSKMASCTSTGVRRKCTKAVRGKCLVEKSECVPRWDQLEVEFQLLFTRGGLDGCTSYNDAASRVWPRLFKTALRLLKDQPNAAQLAEDVAQMWFIEILKRKPSLRPNWVVWPFAFTILERLCLRTRTRNCRKLLELTKVAEVDTPRDEVALLEACEIVRRAVDALPAIYCDAIRRHYFDGMSAKEASQFAGVTPSSVGGRCFRAIDMLRGVRLSDAF